jgi:MFS family permease
MTPVALAFAVLQVSDDPRYLGYVLAAAMIPMIALLLVGGGVADRIRQDRLLLATNLGSGLSQSAIAACVLTRQSVFFLIPLAFVNGVIQAFSGPAMQGIVPKLVEKDLLQKANSLLSSVGNASKLLGPTVAGLLVATVGGGWGIAFDAATFFFSSACLATLSLPDPPKRKGGSLLRDMRDGWAYFRSTRWLWTVSISFTLINVIQLGVWQILGPILAKGSFGAGQWGVVLSTRAAGLLVMSTLLIRLTIRRPGVSGLLWMALSGLPLMLLGLRANAFELAAVAFVAGLGFSYMGIVWDTARHTHIPQAMMSRATSIDDFGSFVAIPVGQLGAVPLASAFGATRVAFVGGVAFVVVALLPLCVGTVRRLGAESEPVGESESGQSVPGEGIAEAVA